MEKQKSEKVVISSLDNSGIEGLLIPIRILILGTKKVDVAIIGANTYCTICKLRRAQVFAISLRDLKYRAEKKVKPETNLRSVVLEE